MLNLQRIDTVKGGPALFLLRLPLPLEAEAMEMLASACSRQRRERSRRYRRHGDATRCLAAGWLVGRAVEELFGLSGIHESPDEQGCPRLTCIPGCALSLAHSGSWAACALHPGGPVGVDVEQPPEILPGMTETFMSPPEVLEYGNLPGGHERNDYFLRHWCLKESWLKAVGCGMGRDPVSVGISLNGNLMTVEHERCEVWHIREQRLADGSLLTLCWQ